MIPYERAQQEPSLAEVLNDPIIRALMLYDAVEERDISALVELMDE